MKPLNIIVLSALLTLTLGACSNKQAQHKKYYRLSNTEVATESKDKSPLTLVVKRPAALSILGSRPMVATQTDGSLIQLSHHFWLESPKVLLQDWLKTWASKHWQKVSYQIPGGTDYQVLETRILAFEKNQTQAKVAVEFFLYNHDRQLQYSQVIEVTQELQGDGFNAFADSVSTAINKILFELHTGLADVL